MEDIYKYTGRQVYKGSKTKSGTGEDGKKETECSARNRAVYMLHFFPASMASPFLHATILIFGAVTISFDSILNAGFLTMNVHTSSQRRYVCKWPCTPNQDYKYEGRGREGTIRTEY